MIWESIQHTFSLFFLYMELIMKNFDTVPFELLNHEVTFRDLAFERLLIYIR